MRKISKSRGDDDAISSTNGSLLNEENMEGDEAGAQGGEPESPDSFKDPPKKRKSKSKSKKRKDDEDDNGEVEDKDTIDDEVSSTHGSVANDGEDADATQEDNDDISNDDNDDFNSSKNKKKKSPKSKAKNKKSGKDSKKKEVEEYEVEKIMGSKKIKGKLHYLIRWKGYGSDDDTWEPEKTVSCPDLITKYHEEKDSSISNSKSKEKTPSKTSKKSLKRKSQPEKVASKRPKTDWDEENADTNAEYEVERILEVHTKKNGKREFLIHWKGWSTKFDSWEPEDNLNCSDLIKKFMSKVEAAKSVDNRSLRPAPESTARFTLQDPSSGRRLSKRRGQRQRVRYDNAE